MVSYPELLGHLEQFLGGLGGFDGPVPVALHHVGQQFREVPWKDNGIVRLRPDNLFVWSGVLSS